MRHSRARPRPPSLRSLSCHSSPAPSPLPVLSSRCVPAHRLCLHVHLVVATGAPASGRTHLGTACRCFREALHLAGDRLVRFWGILMTLLACCQCLACLAPRVLSFFLSLSGPLPCLRADVPRGSEREPCGFVGTEASFCRKQRLQGGWVFSCIYLLQKSRTGFTRKMVPTRAVACFLVGVERVCM